VGSPMIIGDYVYLGDEDGDIAVPKTRENEERDWRVQTWGARYTRLRCREWGVVRSESESIVRVERRRDDEARIGILSGAGSQVGGSVNWLLLIAFAAPDVQVSRVPHNGIQPQVTVEANGTVDLLYFSGDPKNGDLFFVRSGRSLCG